MNLPNVYKEDVAFILNFTLSKEVIKILDNEIPNLQAPRVS